MNEIRFYRGGMVGVARVRGKQDKIVELHQQITYLQYTLHK